STFIWSSTVRHSGISRHILGSLTRKAGESANSDSIVDASWSANWPATDESNHAGLNLPQSYQAVPADRSPLSCKVISAVDSQYPLGLSAVGTIRLPGVAIPSDARTPPSAEVPDRCIPRTMTAARLFPTLRDVFMPASLRFPRHRPQRTSIHEQS